MYVEGEAGSRFTEPRIDELLPQHRWLATLTWLVQGPWLCSVRGCTDDVALWAAVLSLVVVVYPGSRSSLVCPKNSRVSS